MKRPVPHPRAAVKSDAILASLRGRLVRGDLKPGDLLPTRAQLERRFTASRATIQTVFDRLAADGFIAAAGRKGTRVAEHPPHLRRIALVSPWSGPEENRFWWALQREAERRNGHPELAIAIHAGIHPRGDDPAYLRLLGEARAGRLAGAIFATPPASLVDARFPAANRIPRVAIMPRQSPDDPPVICPHHSSFFDRAVAHLTQRGCRRIAAISVTIGQGQRIAEALDEAGCEVAPWRLQIVPLDQPLAARACAHLLLHGPRAQRPDGLIIADDNFVEAATAGIRDAGVPGLHVIGHCNFPWPTPSVLPIRRLGYDTRRILDACLASIAALRAGRRPADVIIESQLDDEVPPHPA
ncbi:MAG: GntR family transcriptional regulator [Planctomycetes bacterium]|nr:GntR family transcriptional regulator [Planctomycetota bacterium]